MRSDFLLPDYNITFSTQSYVPIWAGRGRRPNATWQDFNYLRVAGPSPDEFVHFFGGVDYRRVFYRLADCIPARKVIHYRGVAPPHRQGYEPPQLYLGEETRNWHYLATEAFIRTHSAEPG